MEITQNNNVALSNKDLRFRDVSFHGNCDGVYQQRRKHITGKQKAKLKLSDPPND